MVTGQEVPNIPPRYRRTTISASSSQMFSLCQPEQFARIGWSCFWQTNEMSVMAKRSVNKSALVRDYLPKFPEKGPSPIASHTPDQHGATLTANIADFIIST